jgi:uncharacterized damage-inducible protein DinB
VNESEAFIELFGRVAEHVHGVVDGLTPDDLVWSPAPGANSIGWLVWHLTRVQDDHIADLLDAEQLWTTGPWAPRFGLSPDPGNTGYGHTAAEVATVRPDSADALVSYYDAVAARTDAFLERLTSDELDRVVDERWDPPVTMGVRLVSIADDDIQHAGQAAYLRGLLAAGSGDHPNG